jgi:cytochrome c-type biogenesis protein CcmF
MVVHLGVVLLAVGIAASSSYSTHQEFTLTPGQTVVVDGHRITYHQTRTVAEKARTSVIAAVSVDGATKHPALRQFPNASQAIGSPSVQSSFTQDVYLALLDSDTSTGKITLRVIVEPLVSWIWAGGAVIFGGSLLAAFPGRRRRPTAPVSEGLGTPAAPVDEPEADTDLEPVPTGAPT